MNAAIKDGILIINIPVQTPAPLSKSQKSRVIASTNGNVKLPNLVVNGKPVTIGLNAYIPA